MGLEHYSVTARVLVLFPFYNRGRSFEYLFYYLFPDFPGRSLSSTQFRLFALCYTADQHHFSSAQQNKWNGSVLSIFDRYQQFAGKYLPSPLKDASVAHIQHKIDLCMYVDKQVTEI